jgi:hypothetical protein
MEEKREGDIYKGTESLISKRTYMEVSLVEEASLMVAVDPIHTKREGSSRSMYCVQPFLWKIYMRDKGRTARLL